MELKRKDVALTRAEETIRREQQQIQDMRQRVSLLCGSVCVLTKGTLTAGTFQRQRVSSTPGATGGKGQP